MSSDRNIVIIINVCRLLNPNIAVYSNLKSHLTEVKWLLNSIQDITVALPTRVVSGRHPGRPAQIVLAGSLLRWHWLIQKDISTVAGRILCWMS